MNKCSKGHKNYEHHKRYMRDYGKKNRIAWKEFFIKKYGEKLKCELCKKELYWNINGKSTVFFDHKKPSNIIKYDPALWASLHTPTKKNILIFEGQNFGLLCSICNFFLPTKDRIGWLRRAIKYAKKS